MSAKDVFLKTKSSKDKSIQALEAPIKEVAGTSDLSTFGQSLMDDANAAAARTTLGLGTAALETAPEIGIWTPAIAFGGTADATYAVQVGRYIKFGKRVDLFLRIVLTNNGTGTGAAAISGFGTTPGTAVTVTGLRFSGCFTEHTGVVTNLMTCFIDSAGTTIQLWVDGAAADQTNIGNDADFSIHITYYTA